MRGTRRSGSRAQTSIDFLIGASVFFLTIAFVVGAVPSMIDPFAEAQEQPLVADRVTSEIVGGMMAEPGEQSLLNETCTFAFFNDSHGDGGGCPVPYDETESDLAARLGIDGRYSVNVTVRRNTTGDADPDVLCTDGEAVGTCPMTTRLAAGPTPPDARSVIAARRGAFLDGLDVIVEVKVW